MIKQEIITQDTRQFRHTYSDAGMKILQDQTGAIYDDAMDLIDSAYTYTETDIPIDNEEDASAEDYAAALEDLGVDLS